MNKNKEKYLVLVLIICVTLAFGGGFILGTERKISNNITDIKENNKSNENNSLADTLGKELFEKFSVQSLDGYYFFGGGKLTYNDLFNDSDVMIGLAISELHNSEIRINPNYYINGDNFNKEGIIPDYVYSIKKEYIIKSYKKLFGSKNNPDFSDFVNPFDLKLCKSDDDTVYCYSIATGAEGVSGQYLKYDYSKLENDKLNVYINSLVIYFYDPRFSSDWAHTNFIDDVVYDYDSLFDGNVLKDEYFEKYKGKTGVYKMVFEKDTDGNYYWVETDVVKK